MTIFDNVFRQRVLSMAFIHFQDMNSWLNSWYQQLYFHYWNVTIPFKTNCWYQ